MSRTITMDIFDPASVDSAVSEIQEHLRGYSDKIQRKTRELAERLADIGAFNAHITYANAYYDGHRDVNVTVEQRGENTFAIVASGQTVLFIEFGAGVTYGYGHPNPMEYGPGTYPGNGHWNDPEGWYIPGPGHIHTYGNPPSMAMYRTGQDLRRDLEQIAREVFST